MTPTFRLSGTTSRTVSITLWTERLTLAAPLPREERTHLRLSRGRLRLRRCRSSRGRTGMCHPGANPAALIRHLSTVRLMCAYLSMGVVMPLKQTALRYLAILLSVLLCNVPQYLAAQAATSAKQSTPSAPEQNSQNPDSNAQQSE